MNTRPGILTTPVLLGLLIFTPTLASATTYFVAPKGSDSNPGTQAAPFATLQRAHNVANAGDTIYMRGGVYNISVPQTLSRDGTSSGNPIKVFNYPGEIPILDGSSITGANGTRIISFSNASWWHIKGIEMRNNPRGGGLTINGSSANNIIENNNIHHNGRSSLCCAPGISIYNTASNNLILNNDLHHNRDSTNGNADGIAISGVTSSGNVVRGNRIWRNSDDGVDLWNSANVTIENNWAFENGLDDNLQPLGNGQGFKLGGGGAGDGRHKVRNNLSWKNKSNGFDFNSSDLPITLYNNTAWNNRGSNYIFRNVQNIFRNNIAFGAIGATSGSNAYNSWDLPVTVNSADFASLADACARGPRNADGSLPNCNFLRLATGSDLIDKGVNVGIASFGKAPDLGAYEYRVADTIPPTVPTGLSAALSVSQVSLSWNASTDAVGVTGYRVYRNGTQIAAPASNSYIDATLVPGTYSYTVAAVDAANNVSAQSGIVSATIASPLVPPNRLRLGILSPVSFNVTREEETYRVVSRLTVSPFPPPVQFEKAVTGHLGLADDRALHVYQRV